MMKRILTLFLAICLLTGLFACGQKEETHDWREQYDLGVRYLSEGNYEEAILAFTAAIEIDPKQAEAYIGLADVYTAQGDLQKAADILTNGLDVLGENNRLSAALDALSGQVARIERNDYEFGYSISEFDIYGRILRDSFYDYEDRLNRVTEYDENCDMVLTTSYLDGGLTLVEEYENNIAVRAVWYDASGEVSQISDFEYDENGTLVCEIISYGDGICRHLFFDAQGNTIRELLYDDQGVLRHQYEYYPSGAIQRHTQYFEEQENEISRIDEFDESGNRISEWIRDLHGTA